MDATTWVEISRNALGANFRAVAAHAGVAVCAVVKANAYGHGLVETAHVFARAGAAMLGVTRIEEARALRGAGVDAPVLVLMPVPDPSEAVALGCEITLGSEQAIGTLPAGARVHLKIDTGMGRLGVRPSIAVEAARAIQERATLAGVWTHFADAAAVSGERQLRQFDDVIASLRAAGITVAVHAANSAAAIARPDARFDMVRAGTLLYGQHPVGARAPFPLAETFTWYARVAEVRALPAGATVGYGSEWRAQRPVRVATLPVGWADGFLVEPRARTFSLRRALRDIARTPPRRVFFGERAAEVLGRAAMQAVTVSLEGLDDVGVGSIARIPARRLMVSPLIERVYA